MPHQTPQLSTKVSSEIFVRGLICPVSLGVGDEERSRVQNVRFDLVVEFSELPQAVHTDRVEDTICYAGLSSAMQSVCERKPYHLIEHLGLQAYDEVRKLVHPHFADARLWLQVTKLNPPIPGLTEGASFALGARELRRP